MTKTEGSGQRVSKKTKIIVLAAAGVLVVVGAVIVALFMSQKSDQSGTADAETSSRLLERLPYEQKAADAENLATDGKSEEAIKQLDASIESAQNNDEKQSYYATKATILFNEGRVDEAISTAKQAYEAKKDAGIAAFIGQMAWSKGDSVLAAEYYTKAHDDVNPDSPLAQKDKEYYQSVLNDLRAGKKYES